MFFSLVETAHTHLMVVMVNYQNPGVLSIFPLTKTGPPKKYGISPPKTTAAFLIQKVLCAFPLF